jgi:LmbE family N-acetylglucosaminyl deacetylase
MESLFIPYTATTHLPTGPVLVLAPHPDDEVFGCGGAIMQHVAQGNPVHVIIVTDGSAATTHPDQKSLSNYIQIRQEESKQAAQILGYSPPEFLGLTDRTLECSTTLIDQLFNYIQEKKINQVYAPSMMEIHPDHYALAQIAVEAVRRCGESVSLAMYEIGVPLHPNMLLDITSFFKRKQDAMACFVSQLAIQDYDRHIQGLNIYRCYTLPKTVKAVEGFYVLDGATLQNPDKLFGRSRQNDINL